MKMSSSLINQSLISDFPIADLQLDLYIPVSLPEAVEQQDLFRSSVPRVGGSGLAHCACTAAEFVHVE